jgi:hypothetical protein
MGLTKSRPLSRKAPMKGVKAIGIAPYTPGDLVTNTSTGVLELPASMGAATIARVEVKATGNNIVETGTFDEATRTIEYVGVNTFFIPGNDDPLRTEIQTYAGFLKTIFVEDYNGKIFCLGSQNGCDVMTLVTGSDSQGWTVTINSKELDAAYVLTSTAVTDYTAALMPIV